MYCTFWQQKLLSTLRSLVLAKRSYNNMSNSHEQVSRLMFLDYVISCDCGQKYNNYISLYMEVILTRQKRPKSLKIKTKFIFRAFSGLWVVALSKMDSSNKTQQELLYHNLSTSVSLSLHLFIPFICKFYCEII